MALGTDLRPGDIEALKIIDEDSLILVQCDPVVLDLLFEFAIMDDQPRRSIG